mgnify:CR=1 FL=1
MIEYPRSKKERIQQVEKIYSVADIATYIIRYCNDKNYAVSNLKLQKILYFIQAEFLVRKNRPCFKEKVEAWPFGPVVPEVYHSYKGYGGGTVLTQKKPSTAISETDQEIIIMMIKECQRYSNVELEEMTKRQTPWKQAYKAGENQVISNESIKEFFKD